ncbi:MAG: HAD family hydrolase [Anaerolinea sp.]|nr:HAD family hydrolase [Anaerolinea sp.]
MAKLDAVIFDIGGVLTQSPVTRIMDFCREHGISDETRMAIFSHGESPWSRFERSELEPPGFAAAFDEAVGAPGVSGERFLRWFFEGFPPRPEMLAVVEALRGRVKMGCITNNVARDEAPQRRTSGLDVHSLFSVVVESAKVGMRKPDPRIYQLACELLGVAPERSVFLDDIGQNLKGARALGMTTIRVDHTHSAIAELEEVLGIPLPRPLTAG